MPRPSDPRSSQNHSSSPEPGQVFERKRLRADADMSAASPSPATTSPACTTDPSLSADPGNVLALKRLDGVWAPPPSSPDAAAANACRARGSLLAGEPRGTNSPLEPAATPPMSPNTSPSSASCDVFLNRRRRPEPGVRDEAPSVSAPFRFWPRAPARPPPQP